MYHLNNRPNLPKEPRTSLDIFKMAAELVLLSEALDASIDEELLLHHEEDEEFQVIAATSAFMKRELKRNVGFCEVVVPSYSIDEFRSHFRMTKATFEVLARELAATGAIPTGNRFGRKPIPSQKQILAFIWYMSNMEVIRSVSDRFDVTLSSLERIMKRVSEAVITLKQDYLKWPKGTLKISWSFRINVFPFGKL